MDDFQLTFQQITSLKALHRLQRDRRFADRIKAVVLLGSGWTVTQVAEVLLVDEKTIRLCNHSTKAVFRNVCFLPILACVLSAKKNRCGLLSG